VRAWQAKDNKDWLRRSLWKHDRPKMTKTGYIVLCESVTGQRWQRLATSIYVRAWQIDKNWLQQQQCPAREKIVHWPDVMTQYKRQMLQSECHLCSAVRAYWIHLCSAVRAYWIHLCSPVRAYWIHLSVSSGVSCLPLRTRDKNVYIRPSRSCVLWRTPFTTVHFLAIYTSAIKTDESVTFETLVPAQQNIIHHIS
jgi:hypothetical protein